MCKMDGVEDIYLTNDLINIIKKRLNIEISGVNKYAKYVKPFESTVGFYLHETPATRGANALRAVRELSEMMEMHIDEDIRYVYCCVNRYDRNFNHNVFYEVRFTTYSLRQVQMLEEMLEDDP